MPSWEEISNELARMRQDWSCGRDLRKLGAADFSLRPKLGDVVHRYTRGRCLDFAVRLAEVMPELKVSGFYCGEGLVHAFLMNDAGMCIDVSGIWTLQEMKKLHASEGPFRLRQHALEDLHAAIAIDQARGVDFDSDKTILSVAGCLPHLMGHVPAAYLSEDPAHAIATLRHLKETGYGRASPSPHPETLAADMHEDDLKALDDAWDTAIDDVAQSLSIERWRIEEAFAYGACQNLALKLNEAFGIPIFIATSEDSYAHAFCAVSAEKALDIWGVRSFAEIQSVWSEDAEDTELREVTADALKAMGGAEPDPLFENVPELLVRRLALEWASKASAVPMGL